MAPDVYPPHSFPATRIEVRGTEKIKSPPRTVVKGRGERPFLWLSRGQMETVQQHSENSLLSLFMSKILFTLASPSAK